MPTIVAMADELSSRSTVARSVVHVWGQALAVVALMVAGGFLIAQARPWLIDASGGVGPGAFMAARPIGATVAIAVMIALAGILAAALAHWTGSRPAIFGLGVALAVLPLRAGSILATLSGGQSAALFPVETLLWGAAITLVLALIARTGRQHDTIEPPGAMNRLALVMGIVVGTAIGLAAAWVMAVRPDPGQALAAAVIGSLVATVVVRIVAPDASVTPIVFGIVLAAAAVQAWSWWRLPSPRMDALQSLAREGALPPWLAIRPVDWLAGAPIGAVLGCLWSDSFRVERESD